MLRISLVVFTCLIAAFAYGQEKGLYIPGLGE